MMVGEVTKFAPSVVMPGGRVVQPEGWMWILGYALAGCQWTLDKADTAEFKAQVLEGRKAMRDRELESEIAHLECRLAELRNKLRTGP